MGRLLAVATALCALAVSLPAMADAALPGGTPCSTGFACSTLDVPLDRTGADAGTVALKARTLPASNGAVATTAIVPLAGGPGQAAQPIAAEFARELKGALTTRDLVVFDQRGTGASSPLSCSALSSSSLGPVEMAAHCAAQLGRRRAHFTTLDSVADIESLRQAGGYDKLVLDGTSYGTKVALEYAAAYPEHVESLVLDSTVTPEGPDPLQRSTFHAVPRALRELCAGRCASITKDPGRDLAELVDRLRAGRRSGRFVDSAGKAHDVEITRTGLLQVLAAGDLNPLVRASVPGAVRAALHGDNAPLARLRIRATGVDLALQDDDEGVNQTVLATTLCEESPFPWNRSASATTRARQAAKAIDALPASVFAPFDRATAFTGGLLPTCVGWPVASPAPPASFTLPPVPTLLLAGQQDLRTPLEDARALRTRIGASAQVLEIPYSGHSVVGSDLSGCAEKAVLLFLAGTPLPDCSKDKPLVPVSRVAPLKLSGLTPTGSSKGTPGRTVTAALLSLSDLLGEVRIREFNGESPVGAHLGGLRSGRAVFSSTAIVLHAYSYVPGVLVSGTVPRAAGTAHLTLSGTRAAHGTLQIAHGRITGRLGGVRISLNATSRSVPTDGSLYEALRPPFPGLARLR